MNGARERPRGKVISSALGLNVARATARLLFYKGLIQMF